MISLSRLTLCRGTRILLNDVSLTIHDGQKVGLVGKNGAGKSSLFALFSGALHEASGDFLISPDTQMAQVSQEMPDTDLSACDFVLLGDTRLSSAQKALQKAEEENNGNQMALAHLALEEAGVFDAPARAKTLILGLGFSPDDFEKPVNTFSGGWKMRLQLARALMAPSDLLLLDEPTNHLDLDALVWLENWLKDYAGTMIVISHDRSFLDAVCQSILHIEGEKLNAYTGNYEDFETQRAEKIALQSAAYHKQQDKITHLTQFITRFKAKASKAKQAQSRVKALERMEKIAPILADAEFSFEFGLPKQIPNPMMRLSDVALGYLSGAQGTPNVILPKVTATIRAEQRIGILGANGQGKSTLIKTIARALSPLAGELSFGKGLNIGYFAQQELDILEAEDTPFLSLLRLATAAKKEGELIKEEALRTFLASFLFSGDKVTQKIATLSGGEKARLCLAQIVWQKPNLLLLDEPTNHLDMSIREALLVALNEFEGTVLLVSHDRALLGAVCDEFWLVSGGKLAPFEGDLEDYQMHLKNMAEDKRRQAFAKKDKAPKKGAQTLADTRKNTNRLKVLKRELEKKERLIEQLTAKKTQTEASLSQMADLQTIAQAAQAISELTERLAQEESLWLLMQEEREMLDA